jgi:hypothetical protein
MNTIFLVIQKMNSSRHHVHYLMSKSKSISLKAIYHDIVIYQISISQQIFELFLNWLNIFHSRGGLLEKICLKTLLMDIFKAK